VNQPIQIARIARATEAALIKTLANLVEGTTLCFLNLEGVEEI
jgi:hypothetical protein